MKNFWGLFKVVSFSLAIILVLASAGQAVSLTVYEGTSLTDVSLFGNLSQQNSTIKSAYGDYGCQVTAYTNALV
jgi:hypothetical protein